MIQILFFANLREALGRERLMLALESQATVADIKKQLALTCEGWADLVEQFPMLVAINQEMANEASLIHDGDEVAFFPQVTGG